MASKPVQTTDTHVNSIQFWRCGGFCSIPISKIPQVPTLISGPRNQALLLSLDTYVPHSIGTTADLCGIRPPRSSGTRLRGCSGPFGAHPSTLWAAQFLLHVSMQGCPCSLTGKGSRKCWKFKPHRPPSYTKKKTFACPKLDKNIRDTASIPNHCDVCIISH